MNYTEIIKQYYPKATEFTQMSTGFSGVVKFKNGGRYLIFKKNNIWPTTESEVFFLQCLQKENLTPQVIATNFSEQFIFQTYKEGGTTWKEYCLASKLELYYQLGKITAKIHSINLGNNAGEFRNGYFEYTNYRDFILDRLDWIANYVEIGEYVRSFEKITRFLKEFIRERCDSENVLLHGDLYLENTLHSHCSINAIIDPGEFRAGSRYLDIGIIHAHQPKYENGKDLFAAFFKGYTTIYTQDLNYDLINFFSIFWDLRCYRRLLVEHPDRFPKWFNETFEHLKARLKSIGYS